jgi:predicted NBD/HSP70 family sugar kinase
VVIDHNVGAGVITDGRLLHAGSSSLVEIGHTQVDPYGKRCYCGNHGCLETIASVESVLELAQMHGEVDELDAASAAAERGVAVPGGAAGRFAGAGHYQRRASTSGGFWRSWSICLTRKNPDWLAV